VLNHADYRSYDSDNNISQPTLCVDLVHTVLTKCGQKLIINKKKSKEISKAKISSSCRVVSSSGDAELSVSPTLLSAVLKLLCDLLFPALHFVKICSPNAQ
jgi:hypothetical protein